MVLVGLSRGDKEWGQTLSLYTCYSSPKMQKSVTGPDQSRLRYQE